MGLGEQVFTLIGVVLGAGVSYVGSTVSERARSRRDRRTRLSERQTEAYAAYGRAVKAMFSQAGRIAAARGLNSTMRPIAPDAGLAELDRLAAEREGQWEQVLLLGDPDVIAAARAWHQAIWRLEWYARAKVPEPTAQGWDEAVAESGLARDRFYQSARRSLGISDERLPNEAWPPSWWPDREAGH